jgi:L-iditol 2-dehydrogenase
MTPSVLVDQSEQAPVAVATKSLDRRVIKTPLPNPSLQVTADHRLKSVEAPVYAPGQGEVLVHIKATGICGSDIHFWKTGRIGSLVFEGDCIIGHEASGIVLQCGEGVSHLKPGKKELCYYHFITNMSGPNIYLV